MDYLIKKWYKDKNQTTYEDSINLTTVNFTESEQYLSYNLNTWNKDKLNYIKNNFASSDLKGF